MDLERQRENLKKLTDSQIMAKEGVKDALAARELAGLLKQLTRIRERLG